MKIADLRKKLEIRGLSTAGDEVELLARFQAAMFDDTKNEHSYLSLDSDMDSDGALEDEINKSQEDIILNDSPIDEEFVLAEPPAKLAPKARKIFRKRRTVSPDAERAETSDDDRCGKKPLAKKIKLYRPKFSPVPPEKKVEIKTTKHAVKQEKIVIKKSTANRTSKPKSSEEARKQQDILEMTAAARKQARLKRFGPATAGSTTGIVAVPIDETIETIERLKEAVVKMRKRAARFDHPLSKMVAILENKMKMEKRRARFADAN